MIKGPFEISNYTMANQLNRKDPKLAEIDTI
jgi:hypothetical protein